MSKLTLDEAIKHCLEVAEQNETQADKWREEGGEEWGKTTACQECTAQHRQLAEWLKELKDLREENKVLMSECDRLIKEKGELLKKSEQTAEYKRLLKSVIDEWHIVCEWGNCGEYCGWYKNGKCTQEWSGKAEALKLIGGSENG